MFQVHEICRSVSLLVGNEGDNPKEKSIRKSIFKKFLSTASTLPISTPFPTAHLCVYPIKTNLCFLTILEFVGFLFLHRFRGSVLLAVHSVKVTVISFVNCTAVFCELWFFVVTSILRFPYSSTLSSIMTPEPWKKGVYCIYIALRAENSPVSYSLHHGKL